MHNNIACGIWSDKFKDVIFMNEVYTSNVTDVQEQKILRLLRSTFSRNSRPKFKDIFKDIFNQNKTSYSFEST